MWDLHPFTTQLFTPLPFFPFCATSTQLCGPERSCVNGTTFTKASCPRVNEVEPDAINFRGGDEVVLAGALFVDVGEVQCAFDGVPMGAGETTFVSSSEVRCVAPPGEAETQVDVGIWVDGREYTTTPGTASVLFVSLMGSSVFLPQGV